MPEPDPEIDRLRVNQDYDPQIWMWELWLGGSSYEFMGTTSRQHYIPLGSEHNAPRRLREIKLRAI